MNNKYQYYNNCVNWPSSDIESLEDMIEKEEEITYDQLLEEVSLEQLHEEFPMYKSGFPTMQEDWAIKFFKSELHGKPCVFVRWSAQEYAFKLAA